MPMDNNENKTNVIEAKIDQIIDIVSEVKATVNAHSNDIMDMKIKNALQKQNIEDIKHDIERMNKKSDDTKSLVLGCIGTVVTGIIMVVIHYVIGI